MKRDGKWALAAIAIAASAVLAAGCGTVRASVTTTAPQPTPSNPRPMSAAPTPQQRAESDAASILASFAVPPGATKLPGAPSVGNGVLNRPASVPVTQDLVDDATWWAAPGQPLQVLAWETAHLPHRFSDSGSSSGSSGGVTSWGDSFGLPATAVLNSRTLLVEAVSAGDGQTDLRVDAQVIWIPARPASEVVPSAARAVTLSVLPNLNVHTPPPAPVTITGPAQVRALAAFIDGLPEFPPGSYSCPADVGDGLVLTFRAQASAPALAVATIYLSGCEVVGFTIGGKEQPGLGGFNGRQDADQALKIAGLHWTLPGFG